MGSKIGSFSSRRRPLPEASSLVKYSGHWMIATQSEAAEKKKDLAQIRKRYLDDAPVTDLTSTRLMQVNACGPCTRQISEISQSSKHRMRCSFCIMGGDFIML